MDEPHTLLGKKFEDLVGSEELSGLSIENYEITGDRSYLSFLTAGISIVFLEDMTVEAVQLHAEGHEYFQAYAKPLPFGLDFSLRRSDVWTILGSPDRSGEVKQIPVLGLQPPWDSFLGASFRLHIQYEMSADSIRMITLTER